MKVNVLGASKNYIHTFIDGVLGEVNCFFTLSMVLPEVKIDWLSRMS